VSRSRLLLDHDVLFAAFSGRYGRASALDWAGTIDWRPLRDCLVSMATDAYPALELHDHFADRVFGLAVPAGHLQRRGQPVDSFPQLPAGRDGDRLLSHGP